MPVIAPPHPSIHVYKARLSTTTQPDPTMFICPDFMTAFSVCRVMPLYCSRKPYCVHKTRSLPPYCVHAPVLPYAAWACAACHVDREWPQMLSHSNPSHPSLPVRLEEQAFTAPSYTTLTLHIIFFVVVHFIYLFFSGLGSYFIAQAGPEMAL